jgi:hypothetical protein
VEPREEISELEEGRWFQPMLWQVAWWMANRGQLGKLC